MPSNKSYTEKSKGIMPSKVIGPPVIRWKEKKETKTSLPTVPD